MTAVSSIPGRGLSVWNVACSPWVLCGFPPATLTSSDKPKDRHVSLTGLDGDSRLSIGVNASLSLNVQGVRCLRPASAGIDSSNPINE